jgi:predicted dehydrogenase
MKNRLGFALVGAGRIAQRHADILGSESVAGGRLAAVCDVVPERAAALGKRYGVPHFSDMHEMMGKLGGEIDVVNVLTPSGSHARTCIELAGYRRPIVVEKPMALTLPDADEMIRVCDEAGIKLFVVKQNRYNLPVRKLREAVESGRFGKVVMGTVRVRWMRDQSYYDQDPWRGTWAEDGGVFANQASHHIDLLEWMMGEPVSVFAYGRTALVNIETEDTGVAVVRFRSGALGVIEATTATRPKDLEGSISILGERGTVEIGGFAVNELKVWNFVDAQPGEESIVRQYRENPPNVYGFGHIAYLEHVVDAVMNGSPSLVDGLEGRKSLELITALYESIETGREVAIRFRPTNCRLGMPRA